MGSIRPLEAELIDALVGVLSTSERMEGVNKEHHLRQMKKADSVLKRAQGVKYKPMTPLEYENKLGELWGLIQGWGAAPSIRLAMQEIEKTIEVSRERRGDYG